VRWLLALVDEPSLLSPYLQDLLAMLFPYCRPQYIRCKIRLSIPSVEARERDRLRRTTLHSTSSVGYRVPVISSTLELKSEGSGNQMAVLEHSPFRAFSPFFLLPFILSLHSSSRTL